jgi:hypothetical protein
VVKGVKGMSCAEIISSFPLLAYDMNFAITSASSPDYNCISWAYGVSDLWIWPPCEYESESLSVLHYWPVGILDSSEVSVFISLFASLGYVLCDSSRHESGYERISLHVYRGTTICTHASRELVEYPYAGMWTSKLGKWNDIRHSSPYVFDGSEYGAVHCIMRRAVVLP